VQNSADTVALRVKAEDLCSCSCGTEARNNPKVVTEGETEAVSRKDHRIQQE